MIIYLDMDDVVADWYQSAQDFLNMKWDKEKNERIPKDDWDRLKQHSRFYRDLPLKEGAKELVAWVEEYCELHPETQYRFLTALPKNDDMPWAVYDKVLWVQTHFPNWPMFIGPYSSDKQYHCKPGDILIDDRTSNCEEWRSKGGLAHIYRNWPECKVWLEHHLEHL